MKEFLKKLTSDDDSRQQFTTFEKVMYGVMLPAALVLIMGLAGWLESFL